MRPLLARCAVAAALPPPGGGLAGLRRRLESSQWWTPGRLAEHQLQRLQGLTARCWEIPFYRRRFLALGISTRPPRSLEELAAYPLLEKEDLKELALSLPRSRPGPWGDRFRLSSGTTGVPVRVLADPATTAAGLAARFRCLSWFEIGPGMREARFWGRAAAAGAARWRDALLNREIVTPADLAPDRLDETRRRLARRPADYFYGYASLLLEYGDLCAAAGLPAVAKPPLAAVCTAESTLPHERARLGRALACRAVQEYGCSEVDLIAHECPAGGLHVMAENLILETLPLPAERAAPEAPPDEGDAQAGGPAPAGEALVTDLVNLRMPLLRYRLGDLVEPAALPCPCGRGLPLLASVLGRSRDRFVRLPGGRRAHASSFAYLVERLVSDGFDIRRFQVQQHDERTLTARFVPGADAARLRRDLPERWRAELHSLLGRDVTCDVDLVREIPRAPSGKSSYFVGQERA